MARIMVKSKKRKMKAIEMIINYDMMFSGWLSHIESQPGGRQKRRSRQGRSRLGVSTRLIVIPAH